jgi:hypothetical protein
MFHNCVFSNNIIFSKVLASTVYRLNDFDFFEKMEIRSRHIMKMFFNFICLLMLEKVIEKNFEF